LIAACPEELGGLPTPRLPSEIRPDGSVFRSDGKDVTAEFTSGACKAFDMAEFYHCSAALMKENSPSCGSTFVYDGTFSGKRIKGEGVTVKLFEKQGIKVYNENEIDKMIKENCNV
jgi:uncharacterized protein YbbK (DUF523 family)